MWQTQTQSSPLDRRLDGPQWLGVREAEVEGEVRQLELAGDEVVVAEELGQERQEELEAEVDEVKEERKWQSN